MDLYKIKYISFDILIFIEHISHSSNNFYYLEDIIMCKIKKSLID